MCILYSYIVNSSSIGTIQQQYPTLQIVTNKIPVSPCELVHMVLGCLVCEYDEAKSLVVRKQLVWKVCVPFKSGESRHCCHAVVSSWHPIGTKQTHPLKSGVRVRQRKQKNTKHLSSPSIATTLNALTLYTS